MRADELGPGVNVFATEELTCDQRRLSIPEGTHGQILVVYSETVLVDFYINGNLSVRIGCDPTHLESAP